MFSCDYIKTVERKLKPLSLTPSVILSPWFSFIPYIAKYLLHSTYFLHLLSLCVIPSSPSAWTPCSCLVLLSSVVFSMLIALPLLLVALLS